MCVASRWFSVRGIHSTDFFVTWGRGEGETLSHHVVPTQCAEGLPFCDSIVRFVWCRTKRIDSVCGATWIPLCAKDGSVITWGKGEGEKLVASCCVDSVCGRPYSYRTISRQSSTDLASDSLHRASAVPFLCPLTLLYSFVFPANEWEISLAGIYRLFYKNN